MFSQFLKSEKRRLNGKSKEFQDLVNEMTKQYSFNPPNLGKKRQIKDLRKRCSIEEQGLMDNYHEELDQLHMRYMRTEISILKGLSL